MTPMRTSTGSVPVAVPLHLLGEDDLFLKRQERERLRIQIEEISNKVRARAAALRSGGVLELQTVTVRIKPEESASLKRRLDGLLLLRSQLVDRFEELSNELAEVTGRFESQAA